MSYALLGQAAAQPRGMQPVLHQQGPTSPLLAGRWQTAGIASTCPTGARRTTGTGADAEWCGSSLIRMMRQSRAASNQRRAAPMLICRYGRPQHRPYASLVGRAAAGHNPSARAAASLGRCAGWRGGTRRSRRAARAEPPTATVPNAILRTSGPQHGPSSRPALHKRRRPCIRTGRDTRVKSQRRFKGLGLIVFF